MHVRDKCVCSSQGRGTEAGTGVATGLAAVPAGAPAGAGAAAPAPAACPTATTSGVAAPGDPAGRTSRAAADTTEAAGAAAEVGARHSVLDCCVHVL